MTYWNELTITVVVKHENHKEKLPYKDTNVTTSSLLRNLVLYSVDLFERW